MHDIVEYTQKLKDTFDTQTDSKADLGNLATIESTSTAANAYGIGDYLVLNRVLYRVTSAIAVGDTITVGSNVVADKATRAFVGATSSTAGVSGLVPAPAAGDEDKVFKGDGSWGEMEGGHTILDEDGNSYTQRHKLQFIGMTVTDDEANDTTIIGKSKTYNYGFHVSASDSNPVSAVTYLEDAIDMTPAYMDYSAGTFNYGSWEDAFFMPKPCMLKSDGTVDYYLDPNDYTKKADGTASDVANTAYDGNAMMEWGQNDEIIWLKIVPDSGDTASASVYVSNKQIDEDYHAYPFINNKGTLSKHFYTPIYNGSVISSKMRSLSGQQINNKTTASSEITYATANNPSGSVAWYTEVFVDRLLINMLLILMGKSLQTQTVFGQGLHTSGTEAINNAFRSGVHNTKGLFYGTNSGAASTYTNAVKVFGMENWWGFQWRRIAGWINANGTQKIKLTYTTDDGSTTTGYNTDGSGYISVSGATPAGTNGGYINKMLYSANGYCVPYQASGSDSTYYCDGLWFNNSQVDYAIVGGASHAASLVGAFCSYLYYLASASNWSVGAALSCKP